MSEALLPSVMGSSTGVFLEGFCGALPLEVSRRPSDRSRSEERSMSGARGRTPRATCGSARQDRKATAEIFMVGEGKGREERKEGRRKKRDRKNNKSKKKIKK